MSSPAFDRTGHAELDDALALMERAHQILDGAMGSLEDARVESYIFGPLETAQALIVRTAEDAVRRTVRT